MELLLIFRFQWIVDITKLLHMNYQVQSFLTNFRTTMTIPVICSSTMLIAPYQYEQIEALNRRR